MSAGLSVVLASTALGGVVSGLSWLFEVFLGVAVVVATGIGLRALRAAVPLVALGQLAVLLMMLTAVYSRSGVLVFWPGPAALHDLRDLLDGAARQIDVGVPPVDATRELGLVITAVLGLVAVVVDLLAVAAGTPAAAGLVLLCVFAVPASLADALLPAWTFVCGAIGFALLLATDGYRRRRLWPRGRWANGPVSGGAGLAPDEIGNPTGTVITALAVVLALVLGSAVTAVGTQGRLPGSGSGSGFGTGSSGVGLKPFTALRGQLDRSGAPAELFRVSGLPKQQYLRALTLRQYVPSEGWQVDGLGSGVQAGQRDLPWPPGSAAGGAEVDLQIAALRYRDPWLPVYGIPHDIYGADTYRYDPASATAFTQRAQSPGRYTLRTVFAEPTAADLRAAAGTPKIDPEYLRADGVDPRVAALARQVAGAATTPFDKALALSNYFTNPVDNFHYSLQTRTGNTNDALLDFLLNGKTGYCEQFASAMAVMLRIVGVPSRVAIGFTAGTLSGEDRVITTNDAHAWVEAYFEGVGWITFDPTPLADGRGVVPPYVASQQNAGGGANKADPDGSTTTTPAAPSSTASSSAAAQSGGAAAAGSGAGDGTLGLTITALVLAALAGLIAAPALIRGRRRRRRQSLVRAGGNAGVTAAWRELLDESWDRGVAVPDSDTPRATLRRLVREHRIDPVGQDGLRRLVTEVERSWYGGDPDTDGTALGDAAGAVRSAMRRGAPMSLRAKLWPRSVLRRRKPAADPAGEAAAARVEAGVGGSAD
jgi:transglutaminase-like putative cysteine protease